MLLLSLIAVGNNITFEHTTSLFLTSHKFYSYVLRLYYQKHIDLAAINCFGIENPDQIYFLIFIYYTYASSHGSRSFEKSWYAFFPRQLY